MAQRKGKKRGKKAKESNDGVDVKEYSGIDDNVLQQQFDKYKTKEMGDDAMDHYKMGVEMAMNNDHPAEEAYQMAGHALQMKQMAEMGDDDDSEEMDEMGDSEEMDDEKPTRESSRGRGRTTLEMKQAGKIASLESRLDKRDVSEHLEKVLESSRLPRSMTKAFRESLGKPKSTKEVDAAFKIFKSGMKLKESGQGSEAEDFEDIELGGEAGGGGLEGDEGEGGGGMNFSDCGGGADDDAL